MDEIRIKLLEYVGWSELTRQRKFSVGALKGTSPDGKKDQYAPNPTVSLDSMAMVERFAMEHDAPVFKRYLVLLDYQYPVLTHVVSAADKAKVFAAALK